MHTYKLWYMKLKGIKKLEFWSKPGHPSESQNWHTEQPSLPPLYWSWWLPRLRVSTYIQDTFWVSFVRIRREWEERRWLSRVPRFDFRGVTGSWLPGLGGRQPGGNTLFQTTTQTKCRRFQRFGTLPDLFIPKYVEVVHKYWALNVHREVTTEIFLYRSVALVTLDKYKPAGLPRGGNVWFTNVVFVIV